tara:strand:+ start:20 stop:577 length:558 start_codon:yes stop_codon:yes gene_type:complete
MYKIKSDKKLFIYILSLIGVSLLAILLFVNRPVYLECRFGPYKDKNGINRIDFLPYSVLKINKITRKLTFYHLGSINLIDESLSISDSVKFFSKNNVVYETNFVKQKKLNKKERKNWDKEYLWPQIKDEEYKMSLHRSTLSFLISWKNPQNDAVKELFPEGIEQYTCNYPKKKKKKKYKRPKNKI